MSLLVKLFMLKLSIGADCYDIVPITLVVNTFDPPNFEDETKYLCKGDEITLNVDYRLC